METLKINPVHEILLEAFNKLVDQYNNKVEGINYIDVRNFQEYLEGQKIDITL